MNTTTSNPLIEKSRAAIPGVVFRLPSRGEIYDDGVLSEDVEDGEVTVYPMRLKEEIKMKSPDSILQGTAISETINYCVPQVLDPMKLSPEDVDYLLIAIKKMTHGPKVIFKDICMKLDEQNVDMTEENVMDEMKESNRTNTDVDEAISQSYQDEDENEGESEKAHSSENTSDDESKNQDDAPRVENINNLGENSQICEFSVSLDYFINNSKEIDYEKYKEKCTINYKKFEIEFHAITFKDYKDASVMDLMDDSKMDDDEYFDYINKRSNKNLTDRIKRVDDVTDTDLIYEWVDTLSLKDRENLFEKILEIQDWGVDFNYNLTCESCGKTKKTTQSHINPLYFFLTS